LSEKLEELIRWHVLWKNWRAISKQLGIVSITRFIEELKRGVSPTTFLKKVKIHEEDYSEVENSLKEGVRIIPITSSDYPAELKKLEGDEIYPPLVLYARGKSTNFDRSVAIVGTRNCSLYGRLNARKIARKLVDLDITVVTGFARGIDTEATCGALEAGGAVVAVLPWLGPVYPPENERLSSDVMDSGLLLSENLRIGKFKEKQQFYLRNRVISGLSKAVIVIEPRPKGGTLYQIDYALKRGKRVFVLEVKKDDKLGIEGFKIFLNYNAVPFSDVSEITEEIQRLTFSY
jgi:DNA processing protein